MAFQKNVSPLETLQQARKKGEFAPVYLLHGEETFMRDRSLALLRDALMDPGTEEMNYRQFYFPESSADDVVAELETLPFFAPRKVLVLHDVDALKDKDWERVEAALPKDADTTYVIATAAKTDKRRKIFKHLFAKAAALEMKAPYDNQVPGWIRMLAQEKGKEMHSDAVGTLHRRVGGSLAELEAELTKLADYVGDRGEITTEDVLAATTRSKNESVFELTDALGNRNVPRALEILARLLEDGQSELGILALVARHLRILLLAKDGAERGLSGPQMAQHVGVPPYFLSNYQSQARLWSVPVLKDFLLFAAQTEQAIKTSRAAPEILMDALFLQFGRY